MAASEHQTAVTLPKSREAAGPVAARRKMPFRRWMRELGWRYLVAVAGLFFALFPVVWIVSSSVNSINSLTTVNIVPESLTTSNYTELFEGCSFVWGFPPFACDTTTPVPLWLFNSVKVVAIATSIQLVLAGLAAYSFARLRWRGRRIGLIALLLIQTFPVFLAFVAIFQLYDILEDTFTEPTQVPVILILVTLSVLATGLLWAARAGKLGQGLRSFTPWLTFGVLLLWLLAVMSVIVPDSSGSSWFSLDFGATVFPKIGTNTHTGLVLVYLGGAIGANTWLLKGFMDSIPMSLDEAAKVDGATEWDVFSRIILPLTKPILIVIFFITFINAYNDFILARILIQDVDQFTYVTGLNLFVESQYAAKWGRLTAAAMLGAVPIVVLWLILQDRIVSGLGGAVKG